MPTTARLRGFTLLELVVALTIMGMLLMLGMPSFTTFLRNSEVRSTAESISNGLRAARSEATRLNRPVSFTLAAGTDASWAITRPIRPRTRRRRRSSSR
jgi:type IV fimbrial biogenesis protein FimT